MGSESLIFFGFIHARAMHYFVCVCLKRALFVFERDGALAIDIFKPPKVSARKRERNSSPCAYIHTHVQISISNQLQKWESSRMRKNQFRTLSRSPARRRALVNLIWVVISRGAALFTPTHTESLIAAFDLSSLREWWCPPPRALNSSYIFQVSSPLHVLPSYLFTLIARPKESALEFASWLTQSNLHKQTWPVFSHYGAA